LGLIEAGQESPVEVLIRKTPETEIAGLRLAVAPELNLRTYARAGARADLRGVPNDTPSQIFENTIVLEFSERSAHEGR
jgi:hypothetical protein